MDVPTSTLAENLLEDLDDLSDAEEEEEEGIPEQNESEAMNDQDGAWSPLSSAGGAVHKDGLLADNTLRSHLAEIEQWENSNPTSSKEDADKEYQLVVKSNKWLIKLGDELHSKHVSLQQVYNHKFPELGELLPSARQYQQAVEVIGNEMDITRVSDALGAFLTPNQVITLTVSSSTSGGRLLTETEFSECKELISYMNQIHETQNKLIDFVTARMQDLAPAVCALTGPSLAAQLIGLAGGLVELSVIPACNLQVMGQIKQTSASRAGFGTQTTQPHTGILINAPLVQSVPQSERRKVLKWVAAKVALAARCDATAVQQGRPRSAAPGERFHEELKKKIQQLQTPDQAPVLKALPKYVNCDKGDCEL
jgi:U4/U6 small nuclear ribonucleoprotein PRP31